MEKLYPRGRFTLLELLCVIGIMAVLMALLVPALAKAREAAMRVQCAGKLHSLALAFLNYSDEWRGRLPPYITAAPAEEHPGLNWGWWLLPYYDSPELLLCPSSPGKVPEATVAGMRRYDGSYGWNYEGTQGNRGPLYAHIRQPSQGYLVFDSGDPCIIYGANHWDNLMEELDLDWDSKGEGCNRHCQRVNVAFVDGHVSTLELLPFIAAPCRSWEAPWYMSWQNGELQSGVVPYPRR